MRNAELLTERIQQRFAVYTEPCLVEPCPIIDTGMDHFAVAGTYPRANPALAFDDDDFAPGPSERSCDGETDDARADDKTLNRIHPSALRSRPRRQSFSPSSAPSQRPGEDPHRGLAKVDSNTPRRRHLEPRHRSLRIESGGN